MQPSTIIVLACLVAAVAASVHYEYPENVEVHEVHESIDDVPANERSARTKRSLLLLKKKLILGALGLKAVKVGAVGAGVAALALKKKQSVPRVVIETDHRHAPKFVEVHSWSG